LASDGAKEAMWRLMFAGYRVKAFIHDEILIDLPEVNAERLRGRIHEIMNEVMEDVLGHDMPVESESNLGPTWRKG
jgi:DNA polymerase I-like protein with 3'-5' exonuclease and polymerase domains